MMAATWIKAVHRTNSGSISAAIKRTLDYAKNPDKTMSGELIAAFECDPITAQSEFLLSKRLYEQRTGRNQGKNDVIGYQIRQSFKPGEVTAEQALQIGYELAMRWTRGKHQFVVAAHNNTNNPHTHIFFNSVTLDHSRKFQDFKRSAIALRRISDKLCIENGLSIIEKPGLSKGYNRAEYLGDKRPPAGREKLRELIDNSLCVGMTFPDFLAAVRKAGCEVKVGKQVSIKPPGSKKFFRLDTLGDDYSAEAIVERLTGARTIIKRNAFGVGAAQKSATHTSQNRPSLLIDIQAKIASGKGEGYEQWARIFNIQQAAKTLLFLRDNGIDSYEDLVKKASSASGDFTALSEKIKATDKRLAEITELQKSIGSYSKTREIYRQYISSGRDHNFYEQFRADVTLHMTAKKHFDSLRLKKIPTINALKQEYATLVSEKKKLYSGYRDLKQKRTELLSAKHNADVILGINKTAPGRDFSHTQKRSYFPDR